MKESLGIIPARSGSKRVPEKNIRMLNGIPLIAYTIRAAQQSKKLDRIIVSTDSEDIADIAKNYGAEVPFIRPVGLAQDDTPDHPVFYHALKFLEEAENYTPDIILNLRPTSPFKTGKIIDDVISEFNSEQVKMVRTVSNASGIYHPYWAFKINNNGYAEEFIDGIFIKDYPRSQLLPEAYRINGVVDAMRREIIENDILLSSKFKAVVIEEINAMDIDTEFDFKICELMMKSS